MENNGKSSVMVCGVSFTGLLGIAFIVLKLCGVIDWSWWWVTCPLWFSTALFVAGGVIILVAAVIIAVIEFISKSIRHMHRHHRYGYRRH